jgi:hypothetical protein
MQTTQVKTRKRGDIITLPSEQTTVYQSNRSTLSRYSYSLHQERVFTYIIYYLQEYIKRSMNGDNVLQMNIFNTTGDIEIPIPLADITQPAQYNQVRKAIEDMMKITVRIPYTDADGKKWREITGLFSSIHMPEDTTRSNKVIVYMKQHVAEMVIHVDRKQGAVSAHNYTSFMFEIAMGTKHKYTPRIYKLLCSWRKKGGCIVTVDDLKLWLGLDDSYTDYNSIKRRILSPVAEELRKKADCWFNVSDETFEEKDKGRVVRLHFKIISPDIELTECKLWNKVWDTSSRIFKLTAEQIAQLRGLLEGADPQKVLDKLAQLYDLRVNRRDIVDFKAYTMQALTKEFA